MAPVISKSMCCPFNRIASKKILDLIRYPDLYFHTLEEMEWAQDLFYQAMGKNTALDAVSVRDKLIKILGSNSGKKCTHTPTYYSTYGLNVDVSRVCKRPKCLFQALNNLYEEFGALAHDEAHFRWFMDQQQALVWASKNFAKARADVVRKHRDELGSKPLRYRSRGDRGSLTLIFDHRVVRYSLIEGVYRMYRFEDFERELVNLDHAPTLPEVCEMVDDMLTSGFVEDKHWSVFCDYFGPTPSKLVKCVSQVNEFIPPITHHIQTTTLEPLVTFVPSCTDTQNDVHTPVPHTPAPALISEDGVVGEVEKMENIKVEVVEDFVLEDDDEYQRPTPDPKIPKLPNVAQVSEDEIWLIPASTKVEEVEALLRKTKSKSRRKRKRAVKRNNAPVKLVVEKVEFAQPKLHYPVTTPVPTPTAISTPPTLKRKDKNKKRKHIRVPSKSPVARKIIPSAEFRPSRSRSVRRNTNAAVPRKDSINKWIARTEYISVDEYHELFCRLAKRSNGTFRSADRITRIMSHYEIITPERQAGKQDVSASLISNLMQSEDMRILIEAGLDLAQAVALCLQVTDLVKNWGYDGNAIRLSSVILNLISLFGRIASDAMLTKNLRKNLQTLADAVLTEEWDNPIPQSAAITHIVTVVIGLLSLGIIAMGFTVSKFTKMIPSAFKFISDILSNGRQTYQQLYDLIAHYFFGEESAQVLVDANILEYTQESASAMNVDSTEIATRPNLVYELHQLHERGIKMMSQLPKGHNLHSVIHATVLKLDNAIRDVQQKMRSLNTKQVPTVCIFYGAGGIGKTHFKNELARRIIRKRYPNSPGTYTIDAQSKYFPTYIGQRVALVQEFGVAADMREDLFARSLTSIASPDFFSFEGAFSKMQPCIVESILVDSNLRPDELLAKMPIDIAAHNSFSERVLWFKTEWNGPDVQHMRREDRPYADDFSHLKFTLMRRTKVGGYEKENPFPLLYAQEYKQLTDFFPDIRDCANVGEFVDFVNRNASHPVVAEIFRDKYACPLTIDELCTLDVDEVEIIENTLWCSNLRNYQLQVQAPLRQAGKITTLLLEGQPGSGKTNCISEILRHLQREMSGVRICVGMDAVFPEDSPCVWVVDDVLTHANVDTIPTLFMEKWNTLPARSAVLVGTNLQPNVGRCNWSPSTTFPYFTMSPVNEQLFINPGVYRRAGYHGTFDVGNGKTISNNNDLHFSVYGGVYTQTSTNKPFTMEEVVDLFKQEWEDNYAHTDMFTIVHSPPPPVNFQITIDSPNFVTLRADLRNAPAILRTIAGQSDTKIHIEDSVLKTAPMVPPSIFSIPNVEDPILLAKHFSRLVRTLGIRGNISVRVADIGEMYIIGGCIYLNVHSDERVNDVRVIHNMGCANCTIVYGDREFDQHEVAARAVGIDPTDPLEYSRIPQVVVLAYRQWITHEQPPCLRQSLDVALRKAKNVRKMMALQQCKSFFSKYWKYLLGGGIAAAISALVVMVCKKNKPSAKDYVVARALVTALECGTVDEKNLTAHDREIITMYKSDPTYFDRQAKGKNKTLRAKVKNMHQDHSSGNTASINTDYIHDNLAKLSDHIYDMRSKGKKAREAGNMEEYEMYADAEKRALDESSMWYDKLINSFNRQALNGNELPVPKDHANRVFHERILKNMVVVHCNNSSVYGIGLKEDLILTVFHVMTGSMCAQVEDYRTGVCQMYDAMIDRHFPDRDVCILRITDKRLPPFKDITPLLPTRDVAESFLGQCVTLFTPIRVAGILTIESRTSNINRVSMQPRRLIGYDMDKEFFTVSPILGKESTKDGYCGSPYICEEAARHGKPCFYGIHFAGAAPGLLYAGMFFKDDLEVHRQGRAVEIQEHSDAQRVAPLIKTPLKAWEIAMNYNVGSPVRPEIYEYMKTFQDAPCDLPLVVVKSQYLVRTLGHDRMPKLKPQYEKSMYYDDAVEAFGPPGKVPVKMFWEYTEAEKSLIPYNKLGKHSIVQYNADLVEKITVDINNEEACIIASAMLAHFRQLFARYVDFCSDDEVLNGQSHGSLHAPACLNEYFHPMDFTSAIGYFGRTHLRLQKKGDVFECVDSKWRWKTTPQANCMRQLYNMSLYAAKRGDEIPTIFSTCIKMELLPAHKAWKARVFEAGDLVQTMLERKILGRWLARNSMWRPDNPCRVGINPVTDWQDLYLYHSELPHHFAGDFSRWDKRVTPGMYKVLELLLVNASSTPLHAQAIKSLLRSVCCSYRNIHDAIYHFDHGMPSGTALTAVGNSWLVYISLYVCYRDITGIVSYQHFRENTRVSTYGDDLLVSISEDIKDVFNLRSLADAYKRIFGMILDTDQKDGEIYTYTTLENCTFLSRSFVRFGHMHVGALKEISILARLYWKKYNANTISFHAQDLIDALRESYLWHSVNPSLYKRVSKFLEDQSLSSAPLHAELDRIGIPTEYSMMNDVLGNVLDSMGHKIKVLNSEQIGIERQSSSYIKNFDIILLRFYRLLSNMNPQQKEKFLRKLNMLSVELHNLTPSTPIAVKVNVYNAISELSIAVNTALAKLGKFDLISHGAIALDTVRHALEDSNEQARMTVINNIVRNVIGVEQLFDKHGIINYDKLFAACPLDTPTGKAQLKQLNAILKHAEYEDELIDALVSLPTRQADSRNSGTATGKLVDYNGGTFVPMMAPLPPSETQATGMVVDNLMDTAGLPIALPMPLQQQMPITAQSDMWQQFFRGNHLISDQEILSSHTRGRMIFNIESDVNKWPFDFAKFIRRLIQAHEYHVDHYRVKITVASATGTVGRLIAAVTPNSFRPKTVDDITSSGYDYQVITMDGDHSYIFDLKPVPNVGFASASGPDPLLYTHMVLTVLLDTPIQTTFSTNPAKVTFRAYLEFGSEFRLGQPKMNLQDFAKPADNPNNASTLPSRNRAGGILAPSGLVLHVGDATQSFKHLENTGIIPDLMSGATWNVFPIGVRPDATLKPCPSTNSRIHEIKVVKKEQLDIGAPILQVNDKSARLDRYTWLLKCQEDSVSPYEEVAVLRHLNSLMGSGNLPIWWNEAFRPIYEGAIPSIDLIRMEGSDQRLFYQYLARALNYNGVDNNKAHLGCEKWFVYRETEVEDGVLGRWQDSVCVYPALWYGGFNPFKVEDFSAVTEITGMRIKSFENSARHKFFPAWQQHGKKITPEDFGDARFFMFQSDCDFAYAILPPGDYTVDDVRDMTPKVFYSGHEARVTMLDVSRYPSATVELEGIYQVKASLVYPTPASAHSAIFTRRRWTTQTPAGNGAAPDQTHVEVVKTIKDVFGDNTVIACTDEFNSTLFTFLIKEGYAYLNTDRSMVAYQIPTPAYFHRVIKYDGGIPFSPLTNAASYLVTTIPPRKTYKEGKPKRESGMLALGLLQGLGGLAGGIGQGLTSIANMKFQKDMAQQEQEAMLRRLLLSGSIREHMLDMDYRLRALNAGATNLNHLRGSGSVANGRTESVMSNTSNADHRRMSELSINTAISEELERLRLRSGSVSSRNSMQTASTNNPGSYASASSAPTYNTASTQRTMDTAFNGQFMTTVPTARMMGSDLSSRSSTSGESTPSGPSHSVTSSVPTSSLHSALQDVDPLETVDELAEVEAGPSNAPAPAPPSINLNPEAPEFVPQSRPVASKKRANSDDAPGRKVRTIQLSGGNPMGIPHWVIPRSSRV